jgi:hypothetical protein
MKLKKHIDYWGLAAWVSFWVIIIGLQLSDGRNNTVAQQNIRGIVFVISVLLFAIALARSVSNRKKH